MTRLKFTDEPVGEQAEYTLVGPGMTGPAADECEHAHMTHGRLSTAWRNGLKQANYPERLVLAQSGSSGAQLP